MRGEFIRGDGLVIPNNVSLAGAQMILAAALQGVVSPIYAALVKGYPSSGMTSALVTEPTIGVNGYARIQIAQAEANWILGNNGGEAYAQSGWLTWAASADPGFDKPVNRVCLLGTNAYNAGDSIFCMSQAFDVDLTINVETPLEQRQFKYQLYL